MLPLLFKPEVWGRAEDPQKVVGELTYPVSPFLRERSTAEKSGMLEEWQAQSAEAWQSNWTRFGGYLITSMS